MGSDIQSCRRRLRWSVGEQHPHQEHPVASVHDARDSTERLDVRRAEPATVTARPDEISVRADTTRFDARRAFEGK
jgi:hypothetical protein